LSTRSRCTIFIKSIMAVGMPRLLILVSLTLIVILFFYIFSISSYLKPTVWVLQDRVSYFSPFESYVINKNIDHLIIIFSSTIWLALSLKTTVRIRMCVVSFYSIIAIISALLSPNALLEITALVSGALVISLIIINSLRFKKFLIYDSSLVINYLVIIGILIGIIALAISLAPLYLHPDEQIPLANNLAYEIYLIFSTLSPILLILLILCFPVKIIFDYFVVKLLKINNIFLSRDAIYSGTINPLTKILLLFLFIGMSASMVIIPHQKAINFDSSDIGVDTHYYVQWTHILMNSKSVGEFIKQPFVLINHGDRPITLLFLFTISKIIPSDNLSYVFEYVPIVLAAALILVVYFLTRELTSNDLASLLSAFVTAVSFQTLIGIYAGSYANWLALIVGYLSIIFLLRSLKKTNIVNKCVFFGLIVGLLFTHIYTWSILAMVMGVFLLAILKLDYYERRNVILLLIILSCSVLIDVVRMPLTGAYSGKGDEISPPFGSELRLGPDQFMTRWSNLIDTTHNYYGSLFGNSIIYALGLYWLIRSSLKNVATIFLISFLSIGIIPLFLGNWSVQARVFYDIPFQIPAGIGLTYIYKKSNGISLVLPILIWLLAISITAVSNFYFVPPS
jgi:hypothetical protein